MLRKSLPEAFKNGTFENFLKDDVTTKKWLNQLLEILR